MGKNGPIQNQLQKTVHFNLRNNSVHILKSKKSLKRNSTSLSNGTPADTKAISVVAKTTITTRSALRVKVNPNFNDEWKLAMCTTDIELSLKPSTEVELHMEVPSIELPSNKRQRRKTRGHKRGGTLHI